MTETTISAECNYLSRYATVNGHRLHYLDDGQGIPLVFVHGVGTYSYTWRNIIPHVNDCCRCMALDLLGFGLSDKPNITYDLNLYQKVFKDFIDEIGVDKIILVLHGFGSVIGFDYAMKYPDKVQGIAFMESHLKATTTLTDTSLPVQELIMLSQDSDENLQTKILEENFYIEKILPASILRHLTTVEMDAYRKPFPTPESRKAMLDFMQLTPYLKKNQSVLDCITTYAEKLQKSRIPKLMLYALPGFISAMSTVQWAKVHLPNITLVDIGEALHIPQETQPTTIGRSIRQWLNEEFL